MKKPETFKFLKAEDPSFSMWTASNATYPLIEWMQKMERFAEQYANETNEELTKIIKSLDSFCDIAGVSDEVVAAFSKAEITDEDRRWAREKIDNVPPPTITMT
jgi:hypothetical protein